MEWSNSIRVDKYVKKGQSIDKLQRRQRETNVVGYRGVEKKKKRKTYVFREESRKQNFKENYLRSLLAEKPGGKRS